MDPDVFPMQNGHIPLLCYFTGVQVFKKRPWGDWNHQKKISAKERAAEKVAFAGDKLGMNSKNRGGYYHGNLRYPPHSYPPKK